MTYGDAPGDSSVAIAYIVILTWSPCRTVPPDKLSAPADWRMHALAAVAVSAHAPMDSPRTINSRSDRIDPRSSWFAGPLCSKLLDHDLLVKRRHFFGRTVTRSPLEAAPRQLAVCATRAL
jgi:hypothetical protein